MRNRQMHVKFKLVIIFVILSLSLNGCVSFYGRRAFAHKALQGANPILEEYRTYINNDTNLNTEDKRIRLRTADEFENFLKEGAK